MLCKVIINYQIIILKCNHKLNTMINIIEIKMFNDEKISKICLLLLFLTAISKPNRSINTSSVNYQSSLLILVAINQLID